MMALFFRVLGALEVLKDGRPILIKGNRQRALLATLLLSANHSVPVPEIVDNLWAQSQPVDPRGAVATYVSRLRRTLAAQPSGGGWISVTPGGYSITADRTSLDLLAFHQHRINASQARTDGDRQAELCSLIAALELWCGGILQNVLSEAVHRDRVPPLVELRAELLDRRHDLELMSGHHESVLGELRLAATAEPLREDRWFRLMTALMQAGREAEALAVFAEARRTLADHLGVEPGVSLRRLHERILTIDRTDGSSTPDRRWPVLRQLPAAVADFVGRDKLVQRICSLLVADGASPVITLSGPPGVGKTALAVRVAQLVSQRFSDGLWFVPLIGREPGEVLGELLIQSGLSAAEVPEPTAARAAMLRSQLDGREVLIVVDDALSATQVRPLIPGSGSRSAVLVTGRQEITGLSTLDDAVQLRVSALGDSDAEDLVLRVLEARGVVVSKAQAAALARLCAGLPLALRIAAANLATRPHRSADEYIAELAGEDRLAKLTVPDDQDAGVNAAFEVAYRSLPDQAALVFRHLGAIQVPTVGVESAAAVTGLPSRVVGEALERLARASLIDRVDANRYAIHDLLGLYAADRLSVDEPAGALGRARSRLSSYYLRTVKEIAASTFQRMTFLPLPPGLPEVGVPVFDRPEAARGWVAAELPSMLHRLRSAPGDGQAEVTWHLADALRGFLMDGGKFLVWRDAATAALAEAKSAGARDGEAAMVRDLGTVAACRAEFGPAAAFYLEAMSIYRELDDRPGEAAALNNLGIVQRELGQLDASSNYYARAVELYHELGNRAAEASALSNLGVVEIESGRYAEAIAHQERVLDGGHADSEVAIALHNIAEAYYCQGRLDHALTFFEQALELHRRLGSRYQQASTLEGLARVLVDTGHPGEAVRLVEEGLAISTEMQRRRLEPELLADLAAAYGAMGRHREASLALHQAVDLAESINSVRGRLRAVIGFAELHSSRGETETARRYARDAVALARSSGHRAWEDRAVGLLDRLRR